MVLLSIIVKVVWPTVWPVSESKSPLKGASNLIDVASVSEVSNPRETDPIPLSIFKFSTFIIFWVLFCLVPINLIDFGAKLIVVIVSVDFWYNGISAFPSASINNSPKSWNPAGWVVCLIKSRQISIAVLDLITY